MLILASSSPRRADLLTAAGFNFVTVPVSVDESILKLEPPGDHVRRLAMEKAQAAFAKHHDAVVIGADFGSDFSADAEGRWPAVDCGP